MNTVEHNEMCGEDIDRALLCNSQRTIDGIVTRKADRNKYNKSVAPAIKRICGENISRNAECLHAIAVYLDQGHSISNLVYILNHPNAAIKRIEAGAFRALYRKIQKESYDPVESADDYNETINANNYSSRSLESVFA